MECTHTQFLKMNFKAKQTKPYSMQIVGQSWVHSFTAFVLGCTWHCNNPKGFVTVLASISMLSSVCTVVLYLCSMYVCRYHHVLILMNKGILCAYVALNAHGNSLLSIFLQIWSTSLTLLLLIQLFSHKSGKSTSMHTLKYSLWGIWAIPVAERKLIVGRFDREGLHQLQNWRNYRSDWT